MKRIKLIEHLKPTVLRTLCRRDEPAEYLAAVDKRLAKGEKLTADQLRDITAGIHAGAEGRQAIAVEISRVRALNARGGYGALRPKNSPWPILEREREYRVERCGAVKYGNAEQWKSE